MIDNPSTFMLLVLLILFYYILNYEHDIDFFSFCMNKQVINYVTSLKSVFKQAQDGKIYININKFEM